MCFLDILNCRCLWGWVTFWDVLNGRCLWDTLVMGDCWETKGRPVEIRKSFFSLRQQDLSLPAQPLAKACTGEPSGEERAHGTARGYVTIYTTDIDFKQVENRRRAGAGGLDRKKTLTPIHQGLQINETRCGCTKNAKNFLIHPKAEKSL